MCPGRGVLLLLVLSTGWGCRPPAATVADITGSEWTTLQGTRGSLRTMMGAKATVFITMDPECPICALYAHSFRDLADTYQTKGVNVVGVYPGPFMERNKAEVFAREAGLLFPQVIDSACMIALALHARVTPECFVVDPTGQVVYRGALDDRPVRQGRKQLEAHQHHLSDALEAYLASGEPQPEVVAVGCIVECEE